MFGPRTFTVRASDDSMAPRIERGDHVCVDPDEPAVAGRIVLFGHGEAAVLRLLVVEGGRRVLRALDGAWPEIVLEADNEADLRGVAVFGGRAI